VVGVGVGAALTNGQIAEQRIYVYHQAIIDTLSVD